MPSEFMMEIVLGLGSGFIIIAVANWREHRALHDKIDTVHHSMRDRLERIWKHMNTPRD